MGAIVGAMLCSHIPRLMMSEEERIKYMQGVKTTLFDALPKMYEEKLKNLDFDTFMIFDTHWNSLTHFVIDGREHHEGIYTSEEVPQMISDYPFDYMGDSELADSVKEEAEDIGLRVIVAHQASFPYHYPTLVPMRFLNQEQRHRVLPMSVTFTSSIENELAYGEAIRRAIERSDRRVVLVASGGLSHRFHSYDELLQKASPDLSNIPEQNRKDDELIIEMLKEGDHKGVITHAPEFRAHASPEGRFAHYLRMVGALGGEECRLPAVQYGKYEAAVGTGQVNRWFDVPANSS